MTKQQQQMSPEEQAEYRKLQRNMLKECVSTILGDLLNRERSGETRDVCTPLGNTRGLLSGVLSSLGEDSPNAVMMAKQACESMVDRAGHAEREGGPELAIALREHVSDLSPIVAEMLPQAEAPKQDD